MMAGVCRPVLEEAAAVAVAAAEVTHTPCLAAVALQADTTENV